MWLFYQSFIRNLVGKPLTVAVIIIAHGKGGIWTIFRVFIFFKKIIL